MRLAALLVPLAGCNQVFDLNATVHVDAARIDTAADAAVTCPPIGVAPVFSTQLTQVIAQPCTDYVMSQTTQRALAMCGASGMGTVYEGPVDADLRQAKGFVPPEGFVNERVRLAPDGDFAFARLASFAMGSYRIGTYRPSSDGTWEQGADIQMTATYGTMLAAMTRGEPRHGLRFDSDASVFEEEVEESNGSWTLVGTYRPADLGVAAFLVPYLSPDGLRLVFWGVTQASEAHVFYADRAAITDRFGTAVPLAVPTVFDPFLTEDCRRLYFTSLESVFYVEALAQ